MLFFGYLIIDEDRKPNEKYVHVFFYYLCRDLFPPQVAKQTAHKSFFIQLSSIN